MQRRHRSRGHGRKAAVVGRLIDEPARMDAALGHIDWAHIPDGVRRWTFNAPSGPLAAIRAGDPQAPMVILLPGLTGSKEDFNLLMPALADMGFQSISFDLAGQYESAGDPLFAPSKYDWELFCTDLEALLDDTGPAHLLGLSFAGQVVQMVAAKRPQDVLSMTLLSAPPGAGRVFSRVKIAGPLARLIPDWLKARIMLLALRLNVIGAPADRAEFVRERVPFHSVKSLQDVFALMSDSPDLVQGVRDSGVPALVVSGAHDIWPLELHREYAERIGADVAFYQTGHSPCETVPGQLLRDMQRLMTRQM